LVFEQELVVRDSAYAPVLFELSKAMQYGAWVDSADAIQPRGGKIRIARARIKKQVGYFKGNVFDVFPTMKRDSAAISFILRDFEQKLRSTDRRADLENGLESAIKEMRSHLSQCQANPRTSGQWAGQLAEIDALLDENGILPHVRHILTA
jgi:predicted ribosome quality control (RQC) complex YloA/Tae2 family protein